MSLCEEEAITQADEHTEEKPYICHNCYLVFETQELLRSHIVAQHEDNIFKCQVCKVSFDEKARIM